MPRANNEAVSTPTVDHELVSDVRLLALLELFAQNGEARYGDTAVHLIYIGHEM
jgi:hypothetical protein